MKNLFPGFVVATALFAWLAWWIPLARAQAGADPKIDDLNKAIHAHPRDARLYLARGNAYAADELGDEALVDFDKAIRLNPKLRDAYLGAARCHMGGQEWDAAIADYSAVIRLDPSNEEAHAGRAVAYEWRGGDAYRPDLARSIADFTGAIRLAPADASLHMCRADCYTDIGEREKAIADYNEAIRLKPPVLKDLEDCYARRGRCYYVIGDYGESAADYTTVLQLNAKYWGAYESRGRAYAAMGEYEKAIADYTRETQSITLAYEGLTRIYDITGEKEKAREVRQKLVDYYSPLKGGSGAYQLLAGAYTDLGEFDKAIAVLNSYMAQPLMPGEKAKEEWGIHSLFLEQRGRIYEKKGEVKNAMRDFNEAARLDPGNTNALYDRAVIFVKAHDYAPAIAYYRHAIAQHPYWADEPGELARIYATCPEKKYRNGPKAVALALKACTLTQWRRIDTIDTLAAAEAQAGKFDAAVKWQQQAIDLADAQKGDLRIDEAAMKDMAARLVLYEQKKPWIEESRQP